MNDEDLIYLRNNIDADPLKAYAMLFMRKMAAEHAFKKQVNNIFRTGALKMAGFNMPTDFNGVTQMLEDENDCFWRHDGIDPEKIIDWLSWVFTKDVSNMQKEFITASKGASAPHDLRAFITFIEDKALKPNALGWTIPQESPTPS